MKLRPGRTNTWGADEHDVLDKPRASLYYTTAVNATGSGVTWTIIWEAKEYDTDGMWNPATPTRLTARTQGVYAFWTQNTWVANAFGDRLMYFVKNNTTGFGSTYAATSAAVPHFMSTSVAIQMNAGDYVDVRVLQNTAVGLNFFGGLGNNGFQACLISTI